MLPPSFGMRFACYAAELVLGGLAAELDAYFLSRRRIEVEAAPRPLCIEAHAVQQLPVVRRPVVMDGDALAYRILVAADVLLRRRDDRARNNRGEAAKLPIDGQRKELFARDHSLLDDVLDVHDGSLAGDGDRLLEAADAEIDVDRCGEIRRQLDTVALDRTEADEREGHAVGAGEQIDEFILTLIVGDNGASFFDQDRTAGFHGDAVQHAARGVLHHAGNTSRA